MNDTAKADSFWLSYFMAESRVTPVLIFSSEGVILGHNAAATQLFGTTLLERGFEALFLNFDRSANLVRWADESHCQKLSVATASGFPATLNFSFLRFEEVILAIGEYDGEEMRDLRTALLTTNQQMSNLTRELHRKNAELHRLGMLKNEFLGMAAHDLRSPIGNIYQFCQLLLDDKDEISETHLSWIETMNDLSEFMLTLLNDLLDVTAIEAGKFSLHLEKQEVCKLIDQAILLGGRNPKGIKAKIRWERPTQPFYMVLDAQKFVQAACNLISNAVKYSNPGEIVRVETEFHPHYLRFMVKDHGPGIALQEQKRLFTSYQTGAANSQTGEKSTGLGLRIVKKLVEAHGGTTGVYSEPGSGSCFWFEIPVSQTEKPCSTGEKP